MKKLTALIVALAFNLNANAGVYSFGGGCSSLGSWTQAALVQTENLIKITQTLRDVPACKGIETIVPKVEAAQAALKLDEKDAKRADRIETIPNEIAALRNFAVASPDLKDQVMKLLMSRTLEGAALATEPAAAAASGLAGAAVTAVAPEAALMASALQTLNYRTQRATMVGLDMLDQAFAILPAYEECLMGKPDQGLAMVSAMVKLTASFASSQDGVATRLGRTVSNLVTFMRNTKFSQTLRQLNETEFWMSMSCVLETTSQTYCAARDARKLLDYGIRELKPVVRRNGKVDIQNPLTGYYILTREIPRVAEWLQKIQFGIVPKLTTEAAFKNKILDNVNQLMKDINSIRGLYKEMLLNFSILKDTQSKQVAVLNLLKTLNSKLGSGGGEGGSAAAANINFFTMSVIEEMIPFYLIGLTTMPAECAPAKIGESRIPTEWGAWMLNGGEFQPIFKSPDDLTRTIEIQLEKLIDGALTKASLYYQQRMIVDMANLVNESVTSQTGTVVQSLTRIREYLVGLSKEVVKRNGDIIVIPTIRETIDKISKVLASYESVRKIVVDFPAEGSSDADKKAYEDKVKEAYKNIIETAYEQFNVLLQRDTFLATRLSTLIHYDYAMRIATNDNMSAYEKELLMESGKDILNRILGVTGVNPTAALDDLNAALVVNKRNLEAVEHLFKDSLYPVIDEIKLVTENKASDHNITMRSLYRMYRDTYFNGQDPDGQGPWFASSMGYVWAFSTAGLLPWVRRVYHADLYPIKVSLNPMTRGGDDEFQSFNEFRARLCVQTLSFNDRNFFKDVCKGTVLKSAFTKGDATETTRAIPLDASWDSYMAGRKGTDPVAGDSICAFQTYARRNLVYWMTLDMQDK